MPKGVYKRNSILRPQTYKVCGSCGNKFGPIDRLSRKFCSINCKSIDQKNKNTTKKGRKFPHLNKAKLRNCKICNIQFRAVKDHKNREQTYCSSKCYSNRSPILEKICLYCKDKFSKRYNIYCSRKCRDIDYRQRFKGEFSHLWKGGKTSKNKLLRSSSSFKQWREEVFKRDNYQCVFCNKRSKAKDRIELHPDHIKPLSKFPELAFELSNGRTLCVECHKKTDTWGWKSRWCNE